MRAYYFYEPQYSHCSQRLSEQRFHSKEQSACRQMLTACLECVFVSVVQMYRIADAVTRLTLTKSSFLNPPIRSAKRCNVVL